MDPAIRFTFKPQSLACCSRADIFTLSLGQGSVQCYASYVKKKDDIVLNSMSAGWMNEFVEVVLGSAIIIPIAIGYFYRQSG